MDDDELSVRYGCLLAEAGKHLENYIEENSLDKLKYLFPYIDNEVKRRIKNPTDLFKVLEDNGKLGLRDTTILRILAEELEFKDLEEKVCKYESYSNGLFQRLLKGKKGSLWSFFTGVRGPPVILIPPSSTTTNKSSSVTLTCKVEGKPSPSVTWFKDDIEVDINDSRISLTQPESTDEQPQATLKIRSAYEADEGLYKCRASNGIGQDVTSSAAYLTVNYPPVILESPSSMCAEESKSATLTCQVKGKPTPSVTWFKDGVKISINNDSRISSTQPESCGRSPATLTIRIVCRSDEGSYKCQACNGIGEGATSSDAILTISDTKTTELAIPLDPDSVDVYKMKSSPRGLMFIVNIVNFSKDSNLPQRVGTEKDVDELINLFGNYLDFEVRTRHDLSRLTLLNELRSISEKTDKSRYDCLAVCIMTHGEENIFYAADGYIVKIQEHLINMFTNTRCEAFRQKPKLFFIHACRGTMGERSPIVQDGPRDTDSQDGRKDIVDTSDILIAYSSYEGYQTFRSTKTGSFFIQNLVAIFRQYADKEHVMDLLTRVNQAVYSCVHRQGVRTQVPSPTTSLKKKLYFWPGRKFNH